MPQEAIALHDFTIVYDGGSSVVKANGLILKAAFPILRGDSIKSLILPKATASIISVILKLAYTGRSDKTHTSEHEP